MMRQWKPAKQKPARSSAGVPARVMNVVRMMVAILVVAGAGTALAAATPTAMPTRTTLDVVVVQSGQNKQTVLTAHVTDAGGRALNAEDEAGTVSFEMGSVSLGSAIVDKDGAATLAVPSLPAALGGPMLTVQAVYHPAVDADGTVHAASSVSAGSQLEADATAVPNFSITVTPSSLTATAGQYATTAVTITPSNGFNEQVTLSCDGLPTQVTCTFSPVIASTASGAFTSTLELQTQAASGAVTAPDFGVGRASHVAFAWMLPGVLALAGFASLRRRALGRGTGLVLLLVAGVLGLSGCATRYGYTHHPPSVATGTLAGTYIININAAGNDGSAVTTQTAQVTLQVK